MHPQLEAPRSQMIAAMTPAIRHELGEQQLLSKQHAKHKLRMYRHTVSDPEQLINETLIR